MSTENMYDVIIIGSGPSGLTAAIYTTRASLKTLVIAGLKWGGQLQLTTEVENFPGFPEGIQGPELMMNMRKQAEKFGAEFVDGDIDPVDFSKQTEGNYTVTALGQTYQAKTVLIATGADAKTLGVPGEGKLTGHGVSYCATCDGAFFRGKDIIVVGGGDSAMEEASFLTNFANSVTIVHRRSEFRASQIMTDRCQKNEKIKFLLNTQIMEIVGENKVEKVKLKTIEGSESIVHSSSNNTHEPSTINHEPGEWELPIDGIFVAIGHSPNTKVFPGVEITERGYVKAQDKTRTNLPGIFVSGDVEDDRYRQAITAAGFGAQAALDIEKYLAEHH